MLRLIIKSCPLFNPIDSQSEDRYCRTDFSIVDQATLHLGDLLAIRIPSDVGYQPAIALETYLGEQKWLTVEMNGLL